MIVISEFGYYITSDRLVLLAEHSVAMLAPQKIRLLSHRRPPFKERVLARARAYAAFQAAPALHRLMHHQVDDFLVEVSSGKSRSVAQPENLQ